MIGKNATKNTNIAHKQTDKSKEGREEGRNMTRKERINDERTLND